MLPAVLDPRLLAARLSCTSALTSSLSLVFKIPYAPVRHIYILDAEGVFCTDKSIWRFLFLLGIFGEIEQ